MGELRAAADKALRQPMEIAGAGRTDAGVHARGQVAHLKLAKAAALGPAKLLRELNAALPADIVVLDVEPAPLDFHARHSALGRTYVYQIAVRKTAFDKKYVWWIKEPLDLEAMEAVAQSIVGRHDFRNFQAVDAARAQESSLVVVERAGLSVDGVILFRIEASHFLWRMVRRLVGSLVKVGLREISPEDMARLLTGKPCPDLDVAAWTAPASGLFLESVLYPARLK